MRKERLTAIFVTTSLILLQSIIQCGCLYAAPQTSIKAVEKSNHCHSTPAQKETDKPCCSGCRMDRFSIEPDAFLLQSMHQLWLRHFAIDQQVFDVLNSKVPKFESDDLSVAGRWPNARSVSAEIPLYLSLHSLLI